MAAAESRSKGIGVRKLRYVVHLGSTAAAGGVNVGIATQCAALRQCGIRSVVCFATQSGAKPQVRRAFRRAGIHAFVGGRLPMVMLACTLVWGIRALLGARSVVFQAHSGLPVLTGIHDIVRRILPKSVNSCASLHGTSAMMPKGEYSEIWKKHRARAKVWDAIVVPSEYERETQALVCGREIHKIPNAILPSRLTSPGESTSSNECLVFVGRLDPDKNPLMVLRAFELIAKQRPQCELLMYGDGELQEAIEVAISRLSDEVACRVKMQGFAAAPFDEIGSNAVLVAVPDYESFGLVAYEAALRHVSLVLAKVPAWLEVFEDQEDCLFVDGRNPKSIANGIERMFGDVALRRRCTDNAWKKVAREFSSTGVGQDWCRLYESL